MRSLSLLLIGTFKKANWSQHNEIAPVDVERGIALAKGDMKSRVLRASFDDLSTGDLALMQAMLEDDGPSETAALAKRLGKSASHVSMYRKRLLEQGIIENVGRTRVKFALPLIREYLPEYMATCY